MDPLFILITWLLFFLAGVGVGTFVLGSRIRKVVADAVLYARSIENTAKTDLNAAKQKAEQKIDQIKKVF